MFSKSTAALLVFLPVIFLVPINESTMLSVSAGAMLTAVAAALLLSDTDVGERKPWLVLAIFVLNASLVVLSHMLEERRAALAFIALQVFMTIPLPRRGEDGQVS